MKTDIGQFQNELENYRQASSAKLSYSGQIYASNSLSEKASISFGLGYQNIGNKNDENSSIGEIIYNHHNIQIPILFKYNFTKKWFLRTGMNSIINFKNTITYKKSSYLGVAGKPEEIPKESFRGLNYSYNLGVGFTLFRSSSLDLYAQLNSESTILIMNPNFSIEQRPVSVGLIVGAKF